VEITPGQPGKSASGSESAMLFSGFLDRVGLACVYQNYLFEWTVTEPTKRR